MPLATRRLVAQVLTLPYSLRYRLAYDRKLVGPVLGAFIKSVFASHRHRAKKRHAIASHVNLQPGAVTLIQRFGGAINLNVHFHTLVLGCNSVATVRRDPSHGAPPASCMCRRGVGR